MNHIIQNLKPYAIPFNSPEGTQIEFPQELIASVTSVRSITGRPNQNHSEWFRQDYSKQENQRDFPRSSMVALYVQRATEENTKAEPVLLQRNIRFKWTRWDASTGVLKFPTLERKLQSMEIFFDV